MICFSDKKLDAISRELSWLGINKDTFSRTDEEGKYKWKYDVPNLGFKYHGNSIMASIGIVQLKYLEVDNAQRRDLANLYFEKLKNLKNIDFVLDSKDTYESSKHLCQILVDSTDISNNRDLLLNHLNLKGIFPGVHYRDNTNYPMYKFAKGKCPNASIKSRSVISLPLHLNMTDKDVEYIVNSIEDFFK